MPPLNRELIKVLVILIVTASIYYLSFLSNDVISSHTILTILKIQVGFSFMVLILFSLQFVSKIKKAAFYFYINVFLSISLALLFWCIYIVFSPSNSNEVISILVNDTRFSILI